MSLRRIPMELRLRPQTLRGGLHIRGACDEDKQDLAILLYSAYRGTIDDEGETFSDALAEIGKVFAGGYGGFLSDCSFVVQEGEFLASACLVTWWEPHNAPLVVFTMTRPEARGRGMARELMKTSMNALLNSGYERLTLIVTAGNAPAQHLYASLGFVPIPDGEPEG
jgi:ribosomal protein S18 acetylase RimI-like enzyme